MNDEVYHKLAKILDSLPNGFPSTDSGIEIKLLKKIFSPEDIDLFADLKLDYETAGEIAERTGRPVDGLEKRLLGMAERGQIFKAEPGGVKIFKIAPWALGIYEFQTNLMDREMAEMCEEFMGHFLKQLLEGEVSPMRVIPVERDIPAKQQALPYEKVSKIIEKSQSFLLSDCFCRKAKNMTGDGCDHPLEVCLGMAPVPGAFANHHFGRPATREEARAALDKAEEAGLVHLTWNVRDAPVFICSCCGCSCMFLKSLKEMNMKGAEVIESSYYAEIDRDECELCGVCKDERCHLNAIEEEEESCRVIRELCVGCGVCVSSCPTGAIKLKRKPDKETSDIPENMMDWHEKRAKARGIDISAFRK